jgi:PAS domain
MSGQINPAQVNCSFGCWNNANESNGAKMTTECKVCGKGSVSVSHVAPGSITFGICEACVIQVSATPDSRAVLEAIHAPILLLHGNPRQVVSANKMALRLFGKEIHEFAHR